MKKIFLLGLVALGMLATGCSNEDQVDQQNPGVDKYDAYLTLNITNPAPKTRTAGPVAPDTDGSTIDAVQVYLLKNGVIEYAISPNVDAAAPQTVKAFQVPTGDYKLFVVVNPTSNMPLRTSGNVNMLVTDVTKAQAEAGYNGGTNFLMASACDGSDATAWGEDVTITLTNNTPTTAATATVKVDRAAVKVNSQTVGDVSSKLQGDITTLVEAGTTTNYIQKVEVKGFVLVNGRTQFNLFQKWIASADAAIVGDIIEESTGDVYSKITEFGLKTTDGAGNATAIEDLTLGKDVFKTTPVFTVENRPAFVKNNKLSASQAEATGIIYHTVVNDGTTFWYFKGKIYSADANGLAALNALPEFAAVPLTEGMSSSDMRVRGVKVYENGNMYYTVFLQDQNYKVNYTPASTGIAADTKYYAVHRNSVYNVAINTISNIGDDIPGGGEITPENPNPPIDPDNTYLTVDITINPWVLNEIGVDL